MTNIGPIILIKTRTFKGKILFIVIALFIIYLASLDDFKEYSTYMYIVSFVMIILVTYLWVTKRKVAE